MSQEHATAVTSGDLTAAINSVSDDSDRLFRLGLACLMLAILRGAVTPEYAQTSVLATLGDLHGGSIH